MRAIKTLLYLGLASLFIFTVCRTQSDDDFAEFEEFDDEEFELPGKEAEGEAPAIQEPPKEEPTAADDFDDEAIVEVEDGFNDFDEEEFEGETVTAKTGDNKKDELKFAKVPVSFRRNWNQFYVEMSLVFGMLIYFLNFLLGRSKNSSLAQAWYKANRELLDANFSVVGDDGSGKEAQTGILMKESDHSYVLWCSGRIGVEGMMVQLKLVKRQDLINVLQRMAKPASDQIRIQVDMDKSDMDNFIFCLAQKKTAAKLHKELNDLELYIESKKKAEDYSLPGTYQVLSEIGEATRNFLSDSKVQAFINKYEGCVEYIHFSDQYSGEKVVDDNDQKKSPEVTKSLIFCFNIGKRGSASTKDIPSTVEWTKLVFYLVEKCRRFKLSREAKTRSEKNRLKVGETYNKLAHQQRTELAQQRKEEKQKAETERYMNEEDPIRARKMEEKRQKKEQARKLQKMKSVKIKAA